MSEHMWATHVSRAHVTRFALHVPHASPPSYRSNDRFIEPWHARCKEVEYPQGRMPRDDPNRQGVPHAPVF